MRSSGKDLGFKVGVVFKENAFVGDKSACGVGHRLIGYCIKELTSNKWVVSNMAAVGVIRLTLG